MAVPYRTLLIKSKVWDGRRGVHFWKEAVLHVVHLCSRPFGLLLGVPSVGGLCRHNSRLFSLATTQQHMELTACGHKLCAAPYPWAPEQPIDSEGRWRASVRAILWGTSDVHLCVTGWPRLDRDFFDVAMHRQLRRIPLLLLVLSFAHSSVYTDQPRDLESSCKYTIHHTMQDEYEYKGSANP